MYAPVLAAAPTTPVVSKADAKKHLEVDYDDRDEMIEAFVAAATVHVERVIKQKIQVQTWQQDFDGFCSVIRIPFGPVVAGSVVVSYLDEAAVRQTVATNQYAVYSDYLGSYVRFVDDFDTPTDLYEAAAVRVTWGAGETPPAPLVSAIKLILGDLFANREAQTGNTLQENPTVKALLSTYLNF